MTQSSSTLTTPLNLHFDIWQVGIKSSKVVPLKPSMVNFVSRDQKQCSCQGRFHSANQQDKDWIKLSRSNFMKQSQLISNCLLSKINFHICSNVNINLFFSCMIEWELTLGCRWLWAYKSPHSWPPKPCPDSSVLASDWAWRRYIPKVTVTCNL